MSSGALMEGRSDAADTALQVAIAGLARSASIELASRNLAEVGRCARQFEPGHDVYVPCLPATPLHYILSVATRLREHGMNPVPHFAARGLSSAALAAHFLGRLREHAGVTRVLLVAGDNPVASGPFASSLALLESGVLEACGIREVGVAGYPEGHGRIDTPAIWSALGKKMVCAAAHGLELFIVSQFCFDARLVLDWLAELRARAIGVPVRVGLAGPGNVRTLLKYGMRCGIGGSLRTVLGSSPVSMNRLLEQHDPDVAVRAIAPRAAGLGVAGLHFLPFGGFDRSVRWLAAVAGGRFALREPGFVLADRDPGS